MSALMRWSLIALSVCLLSAPLEAQRDERVGPRARADSSFIPRRAAVGARFLGSVGGVFLGAIAGGYVGYNVLPHECGCDDPGLDALIYGGLVGMTVGAALGTSLADLHSVCSFDTRFGRSLAGAGIAATLSYLLAGKGESIIIAVPFGAIGGSLAGLGKCWNSK